MDMERTLKERPQGSEKMQLRYVSYDLKIELLFFLKHWQLPPRKIVILQYYFKVRNSRSPKKKKGPQTGKAITKAKGDILLHTTTLAKTITEDQVELLKVHRIKTK